jgi:glycosyltransferase involved in cell wall biosynthesis
MGASDSAARPRILVVGPLPPPTHGVSVMTQTLLDSSLSRRYDLAHLDTADRRGVSNIGRFDVGNVRLAALHGLRFVSLLLRQRIDFVYVPLAPNVLGFMRDALFVGPALLAGLPVVLHLHGGGYDALIHHAQLPVRRLARAILGHAHRVIVLGDSLREMLHGVVDPARITVVPNGVPESDTDVAGVRTADGRMRVLFLGNLIPGKGYADLLESVQRLLDDDVDVDVTFAGGVVDTAVHAGVLAAVRYGADRIRFTGSVDAHARARLLGNSDVLVLPTRYEHEAHPLVILEAMAAGLPVVSTRHAAIAETVIDGTTGLLVEKRDVDGLTAALRSLVEQPELRTALGRAGRQRYRDEYTVAHWAARMSRVFDSADSSS